MKKSKKKEVLNQRFFVYVNWISPEHVFNFSLFFRGKKCQCGNVNYFWEKLRITKQVEKRSS